MTDVAEQEGRAVDAVALSSALGLPVIPLVGTAVDGTAADVLLRALAEASRPASMPAVPAKVSLLAEIIGTALPCAPLWAACKLFEGDEGLLARTETLSGERREAIRVLLGDPSVAPELYASRQAWIDAACGKAVRTSGTGRGLTERWDRVFLHPLWGRLAAFLVIPAGCVLGAALRMMTGGLVLFAVLAWAPNLKAAYPGPLGSLVADALLPAFGWVVALLSMISALYAIFSFLEDTGYLARVAYLMDSFLSGLGIDGRSAHPSDDGVPVQHGVHRREPGRGLAAPPPHYRTYAAVYPVPAGRWAWPSCSPLPCSLRVRPCSWCSSVELP